MEKQTKPQKHYIQVWIESEDDLPKKEGIYFCYDKNLIMPLCLVFDNSEIDRHEWLNGIDWYLQPDSHPKGPTDEEMIKAASKNFIKFPKENQKESQGKFNMAIRRGFFYGAKWARDQMQGNLREELINFAQQFYADEETCKSNVDEYLTNK